MAAFPVRAKPVRWSTGWWIVAAAIPLLGPCQKSEKPAAAPKPPVPVLVAAAENRAVPVEIRTIGSVQSYRTVAIKARVGGQITSVGFREGQDLKQGDLLFTLDQRPLQAALAQAKANVARDEAALAKAELDVARYRELRASNAVPEELYQEMLTRRKTQKATLDAGQAAADAANVLLEYSVIHSPIDGRAGQILVDEGNVVKADDTSPLVVINQLEPIYVEFSVAEKHLPEIRHHMQQRELHVWATPPGESTPMEGTLTFLDNVVDRTTGTIQLKATFENADRRLWPGQFVDVVLLLATLDDAVIVPSEAIQTSQQGLYVFVVGADKTAEMRPVTVRMQVGMETVIACGVAAGEAVVTDGHMRLTPGAAIAIK
jgi:multidrug efflux system membrane fusion protein